MARIVETRPADPPPQGAIRWQPGDEVCALLHDSTKGRRAKMARGVVQYASERLVVVAFPRYRESYDPHRLWAPGDATPRWAQAQLRRNPDAD